MPRHHAYKKARDTLITQSFFSPPPGPPSSTSTTVVETSDSCTCCDPNNPDDSTEICPTSAAVAEIFNGLSLSERIQLAGMGRQIQQRVRAQKEWDAVTGMLREEMARVGAWEVDGTLGFEERGTNAQVEEARQLGISFWGAKDEGASLALNDNIDRADRSYEHIYRYYDPTLRFVTHTSEEDVEAKKVDPSDKQSERVRLNVVKIATYVHCYLRQTQVFNVEKRFGMVEEACCTLQNQDWELEGRPYVHEINGKAPTSLRAIWDMPTMHCAKKATKPKASHFKAAKAAKEIQRHVKVVLNEAQTANQIATKAAEIKIPKAPLKLVHYGANISASMPEDIRQRLFDLEFLYEEIMQYNDSVFWKRDLIRSTFQMWISASRECWEYGKTRVHELRTMREYEYERNSMLACCYVAMLEEIKIFAHFDSEQGRLNLTPSLKKVLGYDDRTPEVFWRKKIAEVSSGASSIDVMVAQGEKICATTDMGGKPKPEWEWSDSTPSPAMTPRKPSTREASHGRGIIPIGEGEKGLSSAIDEAAKAALEIMAPQKSSGDGLTERPETVEGKDLEHEIQIALKHKMESIGGLAKDEIKPS